MRRSAVNQDCSSQLTQRLQGSSEREFATRGSTTATAANLPVVGEHPLEAELNHSMLTP